MEYQPITLGYALGELAPFLSEETMQIHYNKYYLAYLNLLNSVLKRNKFDFSYTPQELFDRISEFPIKDRDEIIYGAGGVLNHELYFASMTPVADMEIKEPLKSEIDKRFGNRQVLERQIKDRAMLLTGSGYTMLVVNNYGQLQVLNMSNQDSPYEMGFFPILAIDAWEHAYYLDYKADRAGYVEQFLRHVDYDQVNRNYIQAMDQITKLNETSEM